MEQNNSSFIKHEYKELDEKIYTQQINNCTYNQQSLAEDGKHIQHDNAILQHQPVQCSSQFQPASLCTSLVSNQTNQEYTSTSHSLNAQQTQCALNCATAQPIIKFEPIASPKSISPIPAPLKSQANSFAVGSISSPSSPKISDIQESEMKNTPNPNVTACTENLNPIEPTKSPSSGFRAVEFVLKNLDSAPGEEKFYGWSDKAKDFATIQLSRDSRESFHAQNINSNAANSSYSRSTSVVMGENVQQTDLARYEPSKRKSNDRSTPRKMNKVLKNANWAAERDHILRKYSKNLMRKKPKSWQPQERITDEDLSSHI